MCSPKRRALPVRHWVPRGAGDLLSHWNIKHPKIMTEEKQLKWDNLYMNIAREFAKMSYCKRLQVGAVIVKDRRIISDGYNGTPSGFDNVCEDCDNKTYPYVLHAEANAITKIAASTYSSEGATIYITASPCIECAKLIIQAGITRVVYGELYRSDEGLKLLQKAGVEIFYLQPPRIYCGVG